MVATSEGVSDSSAFTVTQVTGRFVQVTIGTQHTCGLTDQQAVYCWGRTDYGGTGFGPWTTPCYPAYPSIPCIDQPQEVTGGLAFVAVTSGDWYVCGLTSGGSAYCWGSDLGGVLGGAASVPCAALSPCRDTPGAVSGGISFRSLAAGGYHVCGLAQDSTAYCWGANNRNQLGADSIDFQNHHTPIPVYGGHKFVAIATGGEHTCALDTVGAAWCWGRGVEGQLGADTVQGTPVPIPVIGGHTFTQIAAGTYHTCGLSSGGQAFCWGLNSYGQLGDGTRVAPFTHGTPGSVSGNHGFVRISAGFFNSCGITASADLYCWGRNVGGQLGGGTSLNDAIVPVLVPGGLSLLRNAIADGGACGVAVGNTLYCWGTALQAGVGWIPQPTGVLASPTRVAGQP
jgi:alpha-tubulin suppressor-like RCC1 family protein